MLASREMPEKKEEVIEVFPPICGDGQYDVKNLIWSYVGSKENARDLRKYTFFRKDSSPQQAFAIARDYILPAGWLDILETIISENPSVLLHTIEINGIKGTLYQIAIMRGDLSIKSQDGIELVEGMAERLKKLMIKYLPEGEQKAECQAKSVLAFEDKKEEIQAALTTVLNAIRKEDNEFKEQSEETKHAIEDFKHYLKNMRPEVISNAGHLFNLLQMLHMAFDEAKRASQNEDQWSANKSDLFVKKIVGYIQAELPVRLAQIIWIGVTRVFSHHSSPNRDLNELLLSERVYNDDGNYIIQTGNGSGLRVNESFQNLYQTLLAEAQSLSQTSSVRLKI